MASLERGTTANDTRMALRTQGRSAVEALVRGGEDPSGADRLLDPGLPSGELSPPGLEVEALPEGGALVSAASLERAAQRQDSTKAKASLALSWSGGKDSALALLALRAEFGRDPCALITTVTDTYNRISMHVRA